MHRYVCSQPFVVQRIDGVPNKWDAMQPQQKNTNRNPNGDHCVFLNQHWRQFLASRCFHFFSMNVSTGKICYKSVDQRFIRMISINLHKFTLGNRKKNYSFDSKHFLGYFSMHIIDECGQRFGKVWITTVTRFISSTFADEKFQVKMQWKYQTIPNALSMFYDAKIGHIAN